ncbi:diacylglycerol kinase [Caenimonas sedimenti]|uniref:Diacylglycerol kinase n=1 Tax=Caenimonas sedimenti TaxID=2596921 RepID=A0A562ZTI9_9BURK|nr:diacylglycerol kinase family protein [Caenimonas sedimenti]TWO71676.1 diacylglycerol kinase [Caenimonas sedimenti]
MPDTPPPLFVVLNPGSGENEARETRDRIAAVLAASGRPHEIIEVPAPDIASACRTAARRARETGGALVAVGGDGTLNSAAQAALTEGCTLGVIAQGTFNLFAREHGLPLEAEDATRCLLAAQPVPVAVGLVNQRVFLVNASIGLYPRVLSDREAFKQKLGRHRWVALLSGIVSLLGWRRRLVLEIEQDGQLRNLRTPTLFVGNNREQLERVGIGPEVMGTAGRGTLAALAPRPQGRWAKWRLLLRGVTGRLGDSEELDSFAFRSLTVKTGTRRSLEVATDGEVVRMQPPLRFSVSPKPLMLLKPVDGGGGAA